MKRWSLGVDRRLSIGFSRQTLFPSVFDDDADNNNNNNTNKKETPWL
jgi:hypothetical protein